tara:strand:- start:28 stop:192 length:165 start_codon:yes stop_codon:yes gene_type:complete
MKTELKIYKDKGFPKQFWNYKICPITGYSLHENSKDEKKESKKYYTEESTIKSV